MYSLVRVPCKKRGFLLYRSRRRARYLYYRSRCGCGTPQMQHRTYTAKYRSFPCKSTFLFYRFLCKCRNLACNPQLLRVLIICFHSLKWINKIVKCVDVDLYANSNLHLFLFISHRPWTCSFARKQFTLLYRHLHGQMSLLSIDSLGNLHYRHKISIPMKSIGWRLIEDSSSSPTNSRRICRVWFRSSSL